MDLRNKEDYGDIFAAAATVTKTVDFTRNMFDASGTAPKWIWNLSAFVYGVAIAYLSGLSAFPGHRIDLFVTGLAIGAASSGFHEVFDYFSSKAKGLR